MMNRNLHVVYASDDRFAEILGVSLTSLYENNKGMESIQVYVFENGIANLNKKRIDSIAERYERNKIVWIPDKDITSVLNMHVNTDRGSTSQYARLFISSVIPEDIKRILYLDCDIIINKPLDELWNLDLHGNTIAALMDAFSKYYRANIDLKPNDLMFNSGVMLIDLDNWRETHIEDRLMKFIAAKHGHIQQGDQGALNSVLSHSCQKLEPRFNSVTIFYDFSYKEMLTYRKPPVFYSEAEIKIAVEEPVVIHYTTSFLSKRPWIIGCKHRYADEWLKYKAMSPWKDSPLWIEQKLPRWKVVGIWLFDKFPRNFAVAVAGIPQAYIRPMRYRGWKSGK